MTESEYQEIEKLVASGVSVNRAAGSGAKRIAFIRMREKKLKGEKNAIAAVIQEATIAANLPVVTTPKHLILDGPIPATSDLLDMAKRVLAHHLASGNPNPVWVKLCFELCEKELPDWNNKEGRATKDQYEALLETVLKKSTGFRITERKEDTTAGMAINADGESKKNE